MPQNAALVPKLLLNKVDKEKKGRQILCISEYSQIGIANRGYEEENYYVLVFANNDCTEEGEPELSNLDLSELKQAFDLYDHDVLKKLEFKNA